jgi:hypothetical protein
MLLLILILFFCLLSLNLMPVQQQPKRKMSSTMMPLLPITSSSTLLKCKALADNDEGGTVFICSYPKSGTTWLQAILGLLFDETGLLSHVSEFAPFFEIDATWPTEESSIARKYSDIHKLLRHRCFNTHLIPELMPVFPTARYIYVMRRGKDVVTSFFHHLKNQANAGGGYDQPFSTFLDEWLEGSMPYGKWESHIRKWGVENDVIDKGQILHLYYEDMISDLPSSIRKIAEFLQIPLSEERLLSDLVPRLTFEGMRSEGNRYQPISVAWAPGFNFLRNGKVGDRELWSEELLARFDSATANTNTDTGGAAGSILPRVPRELLL